MRLLLPLVLVFASACSSSGVGVDLDPDYDFTGKRSFGWKEGIRTDNELMDRRIVEQVDGLLAARGLERVESSPDLWVFYEVGSRQEVRSSDSGMSVGVSQRTSRGAVGFTHNSGTRVYEVTVGELVLGVLDGPTDAMVWRANAERTVGNDPAKTAESVRDVIDKAFEGFPIPPLADG